MSLKKVSLAKLKKTLRGPQDPFRVEKNVETLVYLECIVYLRELAKQATVEAQRSRMKTIQSAHIAKAAKAIEAKLSVD
ncbi:hypothetical protein PTSG_06439 [Salpingoeca rosetta]|uniref:Transcription factor CBF/NF-Y/archaeal histone domain-containing protein n=1 Tax=Salpingoeca rosetta (strain ATCC 50818 / BSB-021) TaxID=946362 RepID=F2UFT4_SALR5|nr:uncharacterized protein PTSG_06439 [Salpingoeca rosetta]EGD75362.1 hypothetical protein PTSG_06439 [Salpingoeca rosetta]|eukprot:XP_004991819.1 hypothetical protein PTSG_06439 [Salpingoeca rosetta]